MERGQLFESGDCVVRNMLMDLTSWWLNEIRTRTLSKSTSGCEAYDELKQATQRGEAEHLAKRILVVVTNVKMSIFLLRSRDCFLQ